MTDNTQEKEQLKAEDFLISSLKLKNNSILGNMDLSFKHDNGVFSTVIFAGNNGCGKTTILAILNECVRLLTFTNNYVDTRNKKNNQQVRVNAGGKSEEQSFHVSSNYRCPHFMNGTITIKLEDSNNNILSFDFVFDNSSDTRKITVALNEVEITYLADNIFLHKSLLFELPSRLKREGQIKQDIQALYNSESSSALSIVMLENDDINADNLKELKTKKYGEFLRKHFNMGLSLQPHANNDIRINKKGISPFSIDTLSSGEKEIIYRSFSFFDKQKEISKPRFVFIDEPEPNLHPLWQRGVLKSYRTTFDNYKNIQLFVATHSDHILHSALQDNDTLIVKLGDKTPQYYFKNGNGIICPTTTIGEIKWSVFNIATADFHITLYGYIVDKANVSHGINGCDDFIRTTNAYNANSAEFETQFPRYRNYNGAVYTTETLPTYMRNTIHHLSANRNLFSKNEEFEKALIKSINLLIDIIKENNW